MVQDIDVSFVGQPHGKRKEVINYLQRRGVNIRAFGNGFETRLSFDQMVQMYCRSKINLNLSNTANSLSTQIKGRLFEVPACNAFLMTDIAEEMEKYYDLDTEVCTFSDPADLVEQIRFYLANPGLRNQIADAGYQRTIREHTYEHRFNDVFSKAGLL
jgi:spore maturation protein CgeB